MTTLDWREDRCARRDFRRFEGGGLFATLGQEKETAQKASRAFLMTPVSGMREEGYAIVPRSELRELASLEGNLRRERRYSLSFVQDCEHLVAKKAMLPSQKYSLSEPSPVATYVLVATCDREIRRCEATVRAMYDARRKEAAKERAARPWRRTVDAEGAAAVGRWVVGQITAGDRSSDGEARPQDGELGRLFEETALA